MFRLKISHHQVKVEHGLGIWEVCTVWDPKPFTIILIIDKNI